MSLPETLRIARVQLVGTPGAEQGHGADPNDSGGSRLSNPAWSIWESKIQDALDILASAGQNASSAKEYIKLFDLGKATLICMADICRRSSTQTSVPYSTRALCVRSVADPLDLNWLRGIDGCFMSCVV